MKPRAAVGTSMSIFEGINEIIDRELRVTNIGKTKPHHQHKGSLLQVRDEGRGSFKGERLFGAMVKRLEANLRRAPRFHEKGPSQENWRFEKQLFISDHNTRRETTLEKAAARLLGSEWANQVPSASGLWDHKADGHRNVDLVERVADREYRLIELKVADKHPLFAAMEVLGYGALYVLARRHYPDEALASKELLQAKKVQLVVLAPALFYMKARLRWLEDEIDRGLRTYMRAQPDLDFDLGFTYERFHPKFAWPCSDDKLLAGFAGREPYYQR
jgi:hypothetical protein